MAVRIRLARAIQTFHWKDRETEFSKLKIWVLTSEQERRPAATSSQRMCNRGHFDGFRSGANHQPDIGETQYSP
jgi:hypothetical protein